MKCKQVLFILNPNGFIDCILEKGGIDPLSFTSGEDHTIRW
jgi:hypothetical protein